MARRGVSCDLGTFYNEQAFFVASFFGYLVRTIKILWQIVTMRKVFNMIGDRDDVNRLSLCFINTDRGPYLAIRKDRMSVEVTD